jgi:hypothetical protein
MPNPQDLLDCHGRSFISKLVSFAFFLHQSMLLKFEVVHLLVSDFSIDVCVSLVAAIFRNPCHTQQTVAYKSSMHMFWLCFDVFRVFEFICYCRIFVSHVCIFNICMKICADRIRLRHIIPFVWLQKAKYVLIIGEHCLCCLLFKYVAAYGSHNYHDNMRT